MISLLYNYFFQTLTEGDKDCFCGGLVKYSEMLTSVEALLCSSSHDVGSMVASSHDHVTGEYIWVPTGLDHIDKHMGEVSPDPDCNIAAAIRQTLGRGRQI